MTIEEDGANVSDNQQTVVSPKSDEASKGMYEIEYFHVTIMDVFFRLEIVMKSNLSEPGVKKVIKKKVIWADEKNQTLVQTSFFEVDDSELSDMHIFARTCAANISIAQLEKVMERDLRKRRGLQELNSNDSDEKLYSTPLPKLIKILLPETIQIPQVISQERFIQDEREKTVLQALFIRSFLPDSPGEPDGDLLATNNSNNLERTEPKLIPLEDVRIRENFKESFFLINKIQLNFMWIFLFNKLLSCLSRILHHLFRAKSHQESATAAVAIISQQPMSC